MQVELEVVREGEATRRVVLGAGVTQVGRAPDNDLVLADVGVSRRHARIVVDADGGVVVEDMSSGNGTFVAGQRIRRHRVTGGEDIVIDPFALRFRLRAGAGAAPRADEEETALVDHSQALFMAEPTRRGRLVVLQGHGLASEYLVGEAGISMGRSEEREIVLQDPAASRMQADVRSQDGVYWIRDYGSANGTFVNGRRVRERPMQHGDRIRIGSTEFRFELLDVSAPGPSASAAMYVQPSAPAPAPAPARSVVPGPATVHSAPRASGGGLGKGLLVGVVAAVVLLGVATAGALGVAGLTMMQRNRAADAVAAATAALSPQDAANAELMDQGRALFQKGEFLDATAVFYKVLKAEPAYVEAERMCYVSCERLALQQLRADIDARRVPPAERQRLYDEAVAVGRNAVRGRADLDEAERAIAAAAEWFPSDDTLAELTRGIQARRARASQGGGGATRGRTAPSSGDSREARQHLDAGLRAIDEGEFVRARQELSRAVALDRSLSAARSNLADVDRVLEDRARNAWTQGQAWESRGDKSAAVSAYKQVLTYASSRQATLRSQAQARIDVLGG